MALSLAAEYTVCPRRDLMVLKLRSMNPSASERVSRNIEEESKSDSPAKPAIKRR
jgi:hypothetical protein